MSIFRLPEESYCSFFVEKMIAMDFKELHQRERPLLIGNVWDAVSAKVFEKLKFDAIGTSSAAIAHMLGYNDGEEMPFAELEHIVKRIMSATSLPLSVDIEHGYGKDTVAVIENIQKLHQLGVVGINIEDSLVNNQGSRQLVATAEFSHTISEICAHLKSNTSSLFINVRTDAFLIGVDNALEQTLDRISLYEQAGADGIFVPCIERADQIGQVVSATSLPVNVMCMPDLPDFDELMTLGVKRISMGNFLHQSVYKQLEQKITNITEQQSFKTIF